MKVNYLLFIGYMLYYEQLIYPFVWPRDMIFNSYCEQPDLSVADGQGFKSLVGWISVYRTPSDYQKNEQCYHLVICVFIKNLKPIIYFNRMTI